MTIIMMFTFALKHDSGNITERAFGLFLDIVPPKRNIVHSKNYFAVKPPSTGIAAPLMKDDSSDAKNSAV
jgi:hypothetical protein